MSKLHLLTARDEHARIRMVVESPRGSRLKLEFEPSERAFRVARALPDKLVYPYDWGFVPGTLAQDGDPLDAMLIDSHVLYPGVVVPVRALGALKLQQTQSGSKQLVRNDRVIFAPLHDDPCPGLMEVPVSMRTELEQFFVAVARDLGRELELEGWCDALAAEQTVDRAVRRVKRR